MKANVKPILSSNQIAGATVSSTTKKSRHEGLASRTASAAPRHLCAGFTDDACAILWVMNPWWPPHSHPTCAASRALAPGTTPRLREPRCARAGQGGQSPTRRARRASGRHADGHTPAMTAMAEPKPPTEWLQQILDRSRRPARSSWGRVPRRARPGGGGDLTRAFNPHPRPVVRTPTSSSTSCVLPHTPSFTAEAHGRNSLTKQRGVPARLGHWPARCRSRSRRQSRSASGSQSRS